MHPPLEHSPALSALKGVRHGFFGRRGGISEGEFASLNASRYVGDDLANVTDNVHRAVMALKSGPVPVALLRQVHGTTVITVTTPFDLENRPEADAMVTSSPGIALGILTADCAPILLADAEAGVLGAAHAGWRGAVDNILAATVAAMTALGAAPSRIVMAVGPTISSANYEVGDDFAATLRAEHPDAAAFLTAPAPGARPHFDVPGLVLSQARALGLAAAEKIGACTYAHPELYFSHRRATHEGARAGRQIALISKG